MPRLIWSAQALLDVQRLHRFLAEKNRPAAQRAVKAIRDGVKVIAQHPGVGREVDDVGLDSREWVIDFGSSGYLARYRLDGQTVVILAVRHQREAGY